MKIKIYHVFENGLTFWVYGVFSAHHRVRVVRGHVLEVAAVKSVAKICTKLRLKTTTRQFQPTCRQLSGWHSKNLDRFNTGKILK